TGAKAGADAPADPKAAAGGTGDLLAGLQTATQALGTALGAAPGSTATEAAVAPPVAPATTAATTGTQLDNTADAKAIIAAVGQDLGASEIAQQVFQSLGQADAAVDLIDDATFAQKYGARTGGIYDPNTKRIAIPESALQHPELLRIVLLHEGVHWMQDNVPGGIAQAGGPLAQALSGAQALQIDGSTQSEEAQAYLTEAIVAKQLGIADPGMGTTSAGEVLPYDQILAKVKATPEYA
ncbi:MAG: hypothetical protein KDC46_16190, partial [Thermoleophilia bacterium]|nr:hypothetical protein [Thermoleophilia bacterium]